jgi:hypothetical protein
MTAFEPIIARREPWTPGRGGGRRLLSRAFQKSRDMTSLQSLLAILTCVTIVLYGIYHLQARLIKQLTKFLFFSLQPPPLN